MLFKMRRSKESAKEPSVKSGANNQNSPAAQSDEVALNEITSLEEQLAATAKKLEEVEAKKEESASGEEGSGEHKDGEAIAPPKPQELIVEPVGEESDDVSDVVEEAKEEKAAEPTPAAPGDEYSDLFGDEEEDEDPLASLVSSLPEVTVQELFDEAKEVNELLREWR